MTKTAQRSTRVRRDDLEHMLQDRRREARQEVHTRIHEVRTTGVTETLDTGEDSESDIQKDLELALLQMKAETLTRIEEALFRLQAGTYGYCLECEGDISEKRLRALPFAVRCKACEEAREHGAMRARQVAQARAAHPVFANTVG